jgi:hypothetical protein
MPQPTYCRNRKYSKKELQGSALHHTVCFTDLDQGSEMIIFELILTTFIASVVYGCYWQKKLA